jgi:hypothetical protein
MSGADSHRVSDADRAKIAALQGTIETAQGEIAKILAAYFGSKSGKLVNDREPHEPKTGAVKAAVVKKLIAVVDYGNGYGCYYDPPGICERC